MWKKILLPINLLFISSQDPWEILTSSESTDLFMPSGVDLPQLSYVLRRFGILASFLAVLVILIILMVTRDPKAVAEKKKDIEHKLITAAIILSLVTLFNAAKMFFDSVFL